MKNCSKYARIIQACHSERIYSDSKRRTKKSQVFCEFKMFITFDMYDAKSYKAQITVPTSCVSLPYSPSLFLSVSLSNQLRQQHYFIVYSICFSPSLSSSSFFSAVTGEHANTCVSLRCSAPRISIASRMTESVRDLFSSESRVKDTDAGKLHSTEAEVSVRRSHPSDREPAIL